MPEQPVRRQLPGWCEEWKFYYSITENLKSQQQSGTKTDIATDWDCLTSGTLQKRLFQCDKTFCIHLGRLSFSVEQRIQVLAGICAGRWAWLQAGSSLCCAQSLCSKCFQELRAASLGHSGDSSHWIGRDTAGTQELLSLTCHSPQDRWKLCLLPSSRHSDTAQPGSELWHKAKDKFLWQLQFPKKLGGRRGQGKQTGKFSLVYSVCLL